MDLISSGNVLSTPGPEIVYQGTFAHELRHQVDVLIVEHQPDEFDEIFMFESSVTLEKLSQKPVRMKHFANSRHHARLGKELIGRPTGILQHLHGYLLALEDAEHHIAEFTLANVLLHLQVLHLDLPAVVLEILDAKLLLRLGLHQLRAQSVRVQGVVLNRVWKRNNEPLIESNRIKLHWAVSV